VGHLIVRTQEACLSIRGDGTVRVVFVEEYDAEEFVRLSIVRIQADCSFIFCKCAVKVVFLKAQRAQGEASRTLFKIQVYFPA
jgi:hypothetical protein